MKRIVLRQILVNQRPFNVYAFKKLPPRLNDFKYIGGTLEIWGASVGSANSECYPDPLKDPKNQRIEAKAAADARIETWQLVCDGFSITLVFMAPFIPPKEKLPARIQYTGDIVDEAPDGEKSYPITKGDWSCKVFFPGTKKTYDAELSISTSPVVLLDSAQRKFSTSEEINPSACTADRDSNELVVHDECRKIKWKGRADYDLSRAASIILQWYEKNSPKNEPELTFGEICEDLSLSKRCRQPSNIVQDRQLRDALFVRVAKNIYRLGPNVEFER